MTMSCFCRAWRGLAAAVLSLLPLGALAQSAIHYRSFGDWVGQGQTLLGTAPDWTITGERIDADSVRFALTGPGGNPSYHLNLDTKTGTFATGPYEGAQRAIVPGAAPGLDFFGDGRGCNEIRGRFVVLEAVFGAGTTIDKFAVNFEQWCDNGAGPLYGELRLNSAIPLRTGLAAGDAVPDPFALQAQSPVRAGATVLSNAVTIYGVNATVPISITGGEYSLNGAPFTSQAGAGSELGHVVVRVHASTTPGATTQATLTMGGVSAVFSVQTFQPGTPLTGIHYQSAEGDYIGQGETHLFLAPPNAVAASRNFDNGVHFNLETVAATWFNLDLAAPGDATITPGTYESATRFPFQAPSQPGLDFGGHGRGCNASYGRFVVHEAAYAPDGSIERFAADFEQHCEAPGAPPLFGEVRYNSAVPFTALTAAPSRLANISTRAQALSGNDVLIGGFLIGGSTSKTVMVRARGPSLVPFGISNALANPTLQLVRSSDQSLVAANDDWQSAGNAAAVEWSGYAPSNPSESAILVSLAPGAYTAIVSGAGGGTGVAIVEVFELAQPEVRLLNISTRGRVLTGNDVMIGGFIVQGESAKTVVVRGRGPSLAPFGIANALANPRLQVVRSSDQSVVATNDDWQDAANANEVIVSGFAPSDPLEAALRITLQPGAYTVILSGAGATTGVGIVEVFDAE